MRYVIAMQDGEKMSDPIELGKELRDTLTQFTGKAQAVCVYDTGSIRVLLQPIVSGDGKMPDAVWFDLERLEEDKPKGKL